MRWVVRSSRCRSRFNCDWACPFASKPAPTFDLCTPQIQCGSGLAREGASPVNLFLGAMHHHQQLRLNLPH
ncbi:hypothetical protein EYC95_04755 [Pseudomonas sp. BGI-2]|nr:hypothetical protein EYC95_04755 [Pseudomonas sp. BGI-2]